MIHLLADSEIDEHKLLKPRKREILSAKLIRYDGRILAHACPACSTLHEIDIGENKLGRKMFSFNEDVIKPTFYPDILVPIVLRHQTVQGKLDYHRVSTNMLKREKLETTYFPPTKYTPATHGTGCRYWLTNGILDYNISSRHHLAGMKVELPDIPESLL